MKRIFFCLLILLSCVGMMGKAQAVQIQEVTSPGGIKAWLVEDHKLPIISMRFAFRGGVEQDPVDKEGLATLSMDLLTEGAGPYNSTAFQQALADHSISLDFGAGRDSLNGSLKFLRQDRAEAFKLLSLALTQPHIQHDDFDRAKAEQLTSLKSQFGTPDWQARYALFQKIYGNHPYGKRSLGTLKSLQSLTPEDVKGFIAGHLAKDNVIVAVAGDITAEELSQDLDKIFGKLPDHAHVTPVNDIEWSSETATILTQREGTQTELMFFMPAPKWDDPEWYAAEIANYIVGGGGFSSRLMQDVRDKKGLTYGISMSMVPSEHASVIIGKAATDNPKTKEAWDVSLDTMRKFYEDGATPKEIAAAKDYITGASPLDMTSTDKIASLILGHEFQHRPIDYINRRNDIIRAVTDDEVQAAIRHWFNPDRITLSMVGKPDGMSPTETRSMVRE